MSLIAKTQCLHRQCNRGCASGRTPHQDGHLRVFYKPCKVFTKTLAFGSLSTSPETLQRPSEPLSLIFRVSCLLSLSAKRKESGSGREIRGQALTHMPASLNVQPQVLIIGCEKKDSTEWFNESSQTRGLKLLRQLLLNLETSTNGICTDYIIPLLLHSYQSQPHLKEISFQTPATHSTSPNRLHVLPTHT